MPRSCSRDKKTSLCLPEKQHLSFFLPFVAQTDAPPGWLGQLFCRDDLHVCRSTLKLLSPRNQGWQAAPPPWARITGFNSREGLVKCWSSGNIFLKPFGLCRVHRKRLKRGGKTWMMIGAITFKRTSPTCYCATLSRSALQLLQKPMHFFMWKFHPVLIKPPE